VRKLATAAVLLVLGCAPAAAEAKQGISGDVLDSTCYGPCVIDQNPPPYAGDDVVVEVRDASNGDLVATAVPHDGRFRVRLGRGRYSVHAEVSDPLWESEPPQTLRVRRDEFAHVELLVWNAAIV
jgi:hypothetical protein